MLFQELNLGLYYLSSDTKVIILFTNDEKIEVYQKRLIIPPNWSYDKSMISSNIVLVGKVALKLFYYNLTFFMWGFLP